MILISNRRIDRALWNFHRMACTESPPHTHRRIDRALWYFRRMACPESPWPQSNGRIDRALWYFRRMACTEFSPFSPIPTLPVKLDSYTIIVLWSWHQLEEFIELNDISVELLVLSPPPHPLLLPYAKWYYEKKKQILLFSQKKKLLQNWLKISVNLNKNEIHTWHVWKVFSIQKSNPIFKIGFSTRNTIYKLVFLRKQTQNGRKNQLHLYQWWRISRFLYRKLGNFCHKNQNKTRRTCSLKKVKMWR